MSYQCVANVHIPLDYDIHPLTDELSQSLHISLPMLPPPWTRFMNYKLQQNLSWTVRCTFRG
jgi:hypothetical protein